jgi:hypothetical protein
MLHEFQQCLPHPLVIEKDKAHCKFMAITVLGDNSTSEVNFNDDIDHFLTPTDMSWFRIVASCKE